MCEDIKKLRCEEAEIITQRLINLQKSILENEALMTGIGQKHRFAVDYMAHDVYTLSKNLYEKSVNYAKNRIDS